MPKEKALESLMLAKSYLDKAKIKFDLLEPGNKSIVYELECLFSLAWEQIQIAEESDPAVSSEDYNLNEAKLDYHYFLGYVEFIKGDNSRTISHMRQALEIDPNFDLIYAMLANCLWNMGNKEDAIRNIKRAIELNPKNIEYTKELNRMISTSETTISSLSDEEIENKKLANKCILVSIVWAVIGAICGFFAMTSKEFSQYPKFSVPFLFAYIFWSTYLGWKVLHGLFKKAISGITPTGCFVIMPIAYWITIGIFYISILIPIAAIFGALGGGIVTFLINSKKAAISSKIQMISVALFLVFIILLVLFTPKLQKAKLSATKEVSQVESSQQKKIPEPSLLHREAMQGVTPEQKATVAPSISLSRLNEAKQTIPNILERIYENLDQGNPYAISSFITSEILSNSSMLDTICKPFSYRAHYIENIIERPNNKLEVGIRVLFQPLEEKAQILIFGVENDSYILESVSGYPEEWFSAWKEKAKELARNFYYAMKADRQDFINKSVSSAEVIYPKFSSHFGRAAIPNYEEFKGRLQSLGETRSISVEITPNKGLKAHIHFDCESSSISPSWDLYVDSINGEYKIVEWQFEEWGWKAYANDPNIESYTLNRFGLEKKEENSDIAKISNIEANEETIKKYLEQALENISERDYVRPSPKIRGQATKTLECLDRAIQALGSALDIANEISDSTTRQLIEGWKITTSEAREMFERSWMKNEYFNRDQMKSYDKQKEVAKELKKYLMNKLLVN